MARITCSKAGLPRPAPGRVSVSLRQCLPWWILWIRTVALTAARASLVRSFACFRDLPCSLTSHFSVAFISGRDAISRWPASRWAAAIASRISGSILFEEWKFSNYFSSWTNKEPESFGVRIAPPSFKTVYAQFSLFNRSTGAIHLYETPKLDELFDQLSTTVDVNDRDRIQREMGNVLYDEYAYMPFFYTFIEFVANPNIIDNWEFPGTDGANYGHFALIITACFTKEPCYDQ